MSTKYVRDTPKGVWLQQQKEFMLAFHEHYKHLIGNQTKKRHSSPAYKNAPEFDTITSIELGDFGNSIWIITESFQKCQDLPTKLCTLRDSIIEQHFKGESTWHFPKSMRGE